MRSQRRSWRRDHSCDDVSGGQSAKLIGAILLISLSALFLYSSSVVEQTIAYQSRGTGSEQAKVRIAFWKVLALLITGGIGVNLFSAWLAKRMDERDDAKNASRTLAMTWRRRGTREMARIECSGRAATIQVSAACFPRVERSLGYPPRSDFDARQTRRTRPGPVH